MKTLSAHDVLTGLSDNGSGNHTVHNTNVQFVCSECGSSSTFDIRRKAQSPGRILLFDEAMGSLNKYEEDYCDFDCQACGAHVRMVYDLTEISMARYEYYPRTIHLCTATDGFGMHVTPDVRKKNRRWIFWAVALGLVASVLVLSR
jgi:hypothetical protein